MSAEHDPPLILKDKDQSRSAQPQLRACESDQRDDQQA